MEGVVVQRRLVVACTLIFRVTLADPQLSPPPRGPRSERAMHHACNPLLRTPTISASRASSTLPLEPSLFAFHVDTIQNDVGSSHRPPP